MSVTRAEGRGSRGRKAADYDLAGCVVLAAAVIGTRRAKEAAMDLLPVARRMSGRTAGMEATQAELVRRWVEEARPVESESARLLRWAKEKASRGERHAGVEKAPARVLPRAFSRRGKRWQPGVVRGWVLQVLGDTSKSAQDIAEVIGLHQNSIARHLKMLVLSGQVRPVGQRVGAIGRAATLYRREAA